MNILITDPDGRVMEGAKITGALFAHYVGFEPTMIEVDQAYSSTNGVLIKMVPDSDFTRVWIANELAKLFGFEDVSDISKSFRGVVITTGSESKEKERWVSSTNLLTNVALISVPVIAKDHGYDINEFVYNDQAFERVMLASKIIANHAIETGHQFVIIDGENRTLKERVEWGSNEKWHTAVKEFDFNEGVAHQAVSQDEVLGLNRF